MDTRITLQYQAKTEAPPGFISAVPQFESAWHQPWSEPVRKRVISVALIAASGLTYVPAQNVIIPPESSWHQPWSEPLHPKPGLGAALQRAFTVDTAFVPNPRNLLEGWYNWLSEPVRIKRGIPAVEQHFFEFEPEPPEFLDIPWYNWLAEPVRFPKGLKVYLQRAFIGPDRLLPTPTVFVTLNATETNNDVFLGAVLVYNSVTPATSGQGAKVSIIEVPTSGGDPVSIKES